MSASEYEGREQKSSVAVTMNAKGEAQVGVKVYDGCEETELERIRQLAISAYNAAAAQVRA